MMIRSMGTALVFTAATMVLSGGGCSGGGEGSGFVVQTWSEAAPNTSLAEFFDEAEIAEKISITQHTGSMTLSDADIDAIVDFLFFDGELPDLSGSTLAAIADGNDENPARFRITDTADNDFIFRIDSTGNLEMLLITGEDDDFIFATGAKDLDKDLEVGDDVAALVATAPGEESPHFGTLDYMSVVAWATTGVPDEGATEVMVDFGVGHMGLVTPEADIPTDGDAVYAGAFVGVYVEPGTGEAGFVGVATGEAAFTADFGDGIVEGGVHDIFVAGVDLTGVEDGGPAGGIDFDAVTISGNTFSGGVVPGEEGFADFGELSTGTLDGNFYGPVVGLSDGPEEAGVVLTLQDSASDDFVTGVIGAELLD